MSDEQNPAPLRPLEGSQVEFVFTPAGGSDDPVDTLAFTEYLTALIRTLRLVTDFVAHEKTGVEFDLVSLSLNSPIKVVAEAKNIQNQDLFQQGAGYFTDTVELLLRGEEPPEYLSRSMLLGFQRVAEASKKSGLVAAVRTRLHQTTVRPRLSDTIHVFVEDDIEVDGTFEGLLQVLNVRGKPRIRLYPHVGPFVTGRLPRALIPKAKAAVEEYVVVEGTLIYRPNEAHPRRIRVKDIHAVERPDPVPSFDDLWGSGAGYRPDVSSLQLIEEMRSGWE